MATPSHRLRRLALGIVVLAVGIGAWWLLREHEEPVPGPDPSPPPNERAEAGPETPFPEPALRGTGDAEASTPPPDEREVPPQTPTWRLTFDVVGDDGSPGYWLRAEIHDRQGRVLVQRVREPGPETKGELAVPGSGYLVVWSHTGVPWVSAWLASPPSGARHLVVRMDAGLAVAGEVFEQDGATPLASGEVSVWCPASQEPYRPALGAVRGVVQAGRFRVEGLPPGPATVEAKGYDFAQGRKVKVETEAGNETLRLVLGPEGVISFRIVDRSTGLAPRTKHLDIRWMEHGRERSWTVSSRTELGEPEPAKPFGTFRGNPGETYRFRVHAQGYEPSDEVVVTVPETGGRLTARVEIDPAPESVARLTLLVRTLDPPLPEFVMVTRHRDGSSTGHGMPHEGGRIVVELTPGAHQLSVGGGASPWPGRDYWLATPLEIELARDDEREVEVWIQKGGWVFVGGDPDPRPREVTFTKDGVKLERRARWQSWQVETGYFLGLLPPGTWSFEYRNRKRGRRGTVEVRKGEVVRLDPATFEAFEVEEEE